MENADSRLQEMQHTAEEVKVIMHKNLDKVEERSEKLQDLDKRADLLRSQSKKFSRTAVKVKQRKWWENLRMKVLLGAVVLVVVVVLITIIAVASSSSSSTEEPLQNRASTTLAPSKAGVGGK